jgi:hypothetical protein
MRAPRVCERRTLPFELSVAIDGEARIAERLEPPGARSDRPVYVDRELRVTPGRHRVALRFAVERVSSAEVASQPIAFDREVDFEAARVRLLTLDSEARGFELR